MSVRLYDGDAGILCERRRRLKDHTDYICPEKTQGSIVKIVGPDNMVMSLCEVEVIGRMGKLGFLVLQNYTFDFYVIHDNSTIRYSVNPRVNILAVCASPSPGE